MREMVSILMLTHNAPSYVKTSIESLRVSTIGVDYELVVVDNASESETRDLVSRFYQDGLISTLKLLEYNSLFAKGNNIASNMASLEASHFLLLNSDVEIKDHSWLRNLVDIHRRGASSFGAIPGRPAKLDGYCFLIDADLYRKYQLDEQHEWWWSVTKLQAQLLQDGYSVRGFKNHEKYLHHFGGASGDDHIAAKGMDTSPAEVARWFEGKRPEILDLTLRDKVRDFRLRIRDRFGAK